MDAIHERRLFRIRRNIPEETQGLQCERVTVLNTHSATSLVSAGTDRSLSQISHKIGEIRKTFGRNGEMTPETKSMVFGSDRIKRWDAPCDWLGAEVNQRAR